MTFGERLRRLRGGRNQREVAELCGIPQTTYSALENLESPPRQEIIDKLAAGFKIHSSYFTDEPRKLQKDGRSAVLRYVQALRLRGPTYKTEGIGHTLIPDPAEEEARIRRIRQKRVAEQEEE